MTELFYWLLGIWCGAFLTYQIMKESQEVKESKKDLDSKSDLTVEKLLR